MSQNYLNKKYIKLFNMLSWNKEKTKLDHKIKGELIVLFRLN